MDFIREWKSKALDPEQVFGGVLDASQRRFHSHIFFRPTELSDEIGVVPVRRFYRPKVEQEYSTRDRRSHRRSVRFISPSLSYIVEFCALDQSLLHLCYYCYPLIIVVMMSCLLVELHLCIIFFLCLSVQLVICNGTFFFLWLSILMCRLYFWHLPNLNFLLFV